MKLSGLNVRLRLDTSEIDTAIEKANRLVELLREAQQIIDSLYEANKSKA